MNWDSVEEGKNFTCGLISVDIENSSQSSNLVNSNTTKETLKRWISNLATEIQAKLRWDGDGGLIFFNIQDSNHSSNLVTLALKIKGLLEAFNFDIINGNTSGCDIRLRIVCHQGDATFAKELGNIQGDCVNFLPKYEREIGVPNEIIITDEVYRKLPTKIRNEKFSLYKKLEYEDPVLNRTENVNAYRFCNLNPNYIEFCPSHKVFLENYPQLFNIELSEEDNSDLFYLFLDINSQDFASAKEYMVSLQERILSNGDKSFKESDFNVWSLYGSSEMVLEFRSSENDAEQLQNEIRQDIFSILRKPGPLDDPHPNLINIAEERLGVNDINTSKDLDDAFPCGKILRLAEKSDLKKYRTIKAFIKIDNLFGIFSSDGYASIRNSSIPFASIIEKVSLDIDKKTIIIDINMPCGKYPLLNQLSLSLERIIQNSYGKSTFIAYDHF